MAHLARSLWVGLQRTPEDLQVALDGMGLARLGAQVLRVLPAHQVGSEVTGRDLRRRPPERVHRRVRLGRCVARGPAQPAAAAARQEHPAQDRAVRLRIDVRAVAGGDRLGGGHRLLAGKAALLDRGVRRVTGGVDALEPLDQAMLVDGDEAVGVGQARDRPARRAPGG